MSEASNVRTTPDPSAGGGAPAGPASAWYSSLDAETIGVLQTKGWHEKDPAQAVAEAVKSYREAERYIGHPADRLVKLPKDASDEAGWKEVWGKLGVPQDPKDYDLANVKFADGTDLEDAAKDFFRQTAADLHLPKDAASDMAARFVKFLEGNDAAETAERQAKLQEEHAKLDANWGGNKEANLFIARQAALKLGLTPEEVSGLESVVGYARIMEMFRDIGTKIGEDRFVANPNGAPGAMTREQAVARQAELMSDREWSKRYLAGGAAEKREMEALLRMITGVTEVY